MKRQQTKHRKDWTILIYAGGNNELEPELYRAMLAAEQAGSNERVNVVMQLGREQRELVRMMRPLEQIVDEPDSWHGVRRYYLLKTGSILLQDYGNLNMADPNNLADFIHWGITAYPARHYLLSLAGHGVSFVGILPDLSQNMPYMLGVAQICKVLHDLRQATKITIDILVLDICYMNTIEIFYELGWSRFPPVKYLLTYVKDGPLGGLPYDRLTELVQDAGHHPHVRSLLQKITAAIGQNIIAVAINHRQLVKFKQTLSRLAISGWRQQPGHPVTQELLHGLANDTGQVKKARRQLKRSLSRMVISHDPQITLEKWRMITIIDWEMTFEPEKIDYSALTYFSLHFSVANHWSQRLINTSPGTDFPEYPCFNLGMQDKPLLVPPVVFTNWVQAINPTLNDAATRQLIDQLFSRKKWDLTELGKQLTAEIEAYQVQHRECPWRPGVCSRDDSFPHLPRSIVQWFEKVFHKRNQ